MSISRYLGIGKEMTFAQSATPDFWLDPESVELDPSGDQIIVYEGMSGVDRVAALGRYATEGSFTLPVDTGAAGHIFRGVLGGYSKTGTAPSVTHLFTPDRNKIDTYTLRVGKDIMSHDFIGTVFTGFSIEAEEGIVLMSVDCAGVKDAKSSLTTSPQLASEVFTTQHVGLSLDGTDKSADIMSMSLSVENGAEAVYGFGSRFASNFRKGSFVVEAEITLGFYSTAELERFWGGASGPTATKVSPFSMTINIGPNLDITIPKAVYTAMGQPVEGRDSITQTATIRGLVDPANNEGPISISLTGSTANY